MGKAKKRGFNLKQKNQYTNITRKDAIKEAVKLLEAKDDANYLISLFGLTEEELLEGGADYENLWVWLLQNLTKTCILKSFLLL